MDFGTKLPRTTKKHDSIWVIVDRLTKGAHFIPIRENMPVHKLAKIYVNEIVARHRVPVSIVSNRDGRFTSNFWRDFQEELGSRELASTDVVLATTEKIETIRERLKAPQDRWKSYADNRRRPIEFNAGDFVMLKVSP
ncbi:retrotransposon protein, putative, ty3-gypsy subclass [Tanacetum coccineum]